MEKLGEKGVGGRGRMGEKGGVFGALCVLAFWEYGCGISVGVFENAGFMVASRGGFFAFFSWLWLDFFVLHIMICKITKQKYQQNQCVIK